MTLGRGPCSGTNQGNKEVQCRAAVPVDKNKRNALYMSRTLVWAH
jgi:hypothetical protein